MKTLNNYTYHITLTTDHAIDIAWTDIEDYLLNNTSSSDFEITENNKTLTVTYTHSDDLATVFNHICNEADNDDMVLKGDLDNYTSLIGSFNTLGEAQAFTENLDNDLTNGNNFIFEQLPDMVVLYVSPQDTIANSTIQELQEAYIMHEADYEPDTFKLNYHDMRVSQLKALDKDTLISDIILYELELLDHADRLLSDEPLPLDDQHGFETIELLGDDVIKLVKELDTNKELDGIRDYIIGE